MRVVHDLTLFSTAEFIFVASGDSAVGDAAAADRRDGRSQATLDIVENIDPAVLLVLIRVDLAWDMARTVYMYAKNAIESPIFDTLILFSM